MTMSDYFALTPSPIREEAVEAWAAEFSPRHPILGALAFLEADERVNFTYERKADGWPTDAVPLPDSEFVRMVTEPVSAESAIREWLLGYAWAEDSQEAKEAVVDCIMAQGDWRYLDARADRYAGAQWEPGPAAFSEGVQFELSALYECHDGPHTEQCAER